MKRLVFFLLTLYSANAQAQQSTLAESDVLRGQFTETRHMHGFNGPMTNQGHFLVAPSHGLIWDMEKPFAVTTIITPNGLKQYAAGEEITNLDASKMPFLISLYEALGGALAESTQALDKDFIVTRTQKEDAWTIDLKPRQSDMVTMPFNAIHIEGHRFIDKVHMVRNDGDSEDIDFRNQSVSHNALGPDELKMLSAPSS